MINLSKRLSAIKALVPNGARACDVGTDHCYLPIDLILSGKCSYVIGSDINQKPLDNAAKNIKKYGVQNIDLIKSDGLHNIDCSSIDTIIIAGMGGEVISEIIERDLKIFQSFEKTIILQPTTSPEILREYLYSKGFDIQTEIPIAENGKIYSVMRVEYKSYTTTKPFYKYYIGNITPESREGLQYINKQYNRLNKCCQQIENNPKKAEEYKKYKTVCQDIEILLKG